MRYILATAVLFLQLNLMANQPEGKPRIINTTDLGADPDDEQSMVRQLVCANEFDIEGLIVSTGCWKKTRQVLNMTATAGSIIELSANGSKDPDGNSLTYSWFFYDEPSSYDGSLTIQNSSDPTVNMEIPDDANGKTIHIILEIHDDGVPNLYAYRRMIINVRP